MYARYCKRALDLLLALVGLAVLWPLFLVLTVTGAVALRGNPFFVQRRPGMIQPRTGQEKIFPLVKFRSMSNAKDARGNLLEDRYRLGKYGKFLRTTSLDELPQLWNVLLGHMSLVGPRPLLVEYLPRYSPRQRRRHLVRPGMTGYAQISGRNGLNWPERFEKDLQYVEHISLWTDLKILAGTAKAILKGESASGVTVEIFSGDGEFVEPG